MPRPAAPMLFDNYALTLDGYVLPLQAWQAEGQPQAIVLALHGFNDYHQAFAGVGSFLSKHGISTYAYDQRGFGATVYRGRWPGTARLVSDLKSVATLLRARHPDLPLFLLGESMGGAVVMSALGRPNPPEVEGVVLGAPAVWGRSTMSVFMRGLLWVSANAMPWYRVTGEGLGIIASDNKEMLQALGRDPLVIKPTRIDAIGGLADLMDEALAAAPRINLPALILYGEHDQVIPRRPFCRMVQTLPNGSDRRWRIALYPNGYHMLMRDLQANTVLMDIATWVLDPLSPLPSGLELSSAARISGRFCGGV